MSKGLADVAVWPLIAAPAAVRAVRRRVRRLCLCGTVLSVVEVKTVADIAEHSRRSFLLLLHLNQTGEKVETQANVFIENSQQTLQKQCMCGVRSSAQVIITLIIKINTSFEGN